MIAPGAHRPIQAVVAFTAPSSRIHTFTLSARPRHQQLGAFDDAWPICRDPGARARPRGAPCQSRSLLRDPPSSPSPRDARCADPHSGPAVARANILRRSCGGSVRGGLHEALAIVDARIAQFRSRLPSSPASGRILAAAACRRLRPRYSTRRWRASARRSYSTKALDPRDRQNRARTRAADCASGGSPRPARRSSTAAPS